MFHIMKSLTVTPCPRRQFFIQVHNIWMERTVKLSGSLGLAVIVGTKAVSSGAFLSGWIFQKVSKGQKFPTLS